jgi:hypothetical protein
MNRDAQTKQESDRKDPIVLSLIRRRFRHISVAAIMLIVLAGTSFAIAQEPEDSSSPATEESAPAPDEGNEGNDGEDGDGDSGGGDGDQNNGGDDEADEGDTSEPAESGPFSVTVREGDEVETDLDRLEVLATARCEDDEVLTGGGVRTTDPTRGAKPSVQASHPSPDDALEWQATVLNTTGNGKLTVVVYAMCASSSAP